MLVVATLVPQTPEHVRAAHPEGADVLEVRLDGLDHDDVAEAVQAADRPALVTCRRSEDGGVTELAEDERRKRLQAGLEAGADLIDLELDADFREDLARQAHRHNATVIVSDHRLEQAIDADEILALLEQLGRAGDVAKLATQPETPDDVHALAQAGLEASTLGTPFALMGVGDPLLRGLAGSLGQALVYAAPQESKVPGQLPADLQARLPRDPPSPSPDQDYALIGHPVEHSLSPRMQEAAFRKLGLPARYRLIDAAPDRLDTVLDGLRATSLGANVTAPHKRAVYEAADETTAVADQVGHANTLRFEEDRILAHMTDGLGAVDALRAREEPLEDRPTLIVGAGGTAHAVAHALADEGAQLTIANRTRKKAQRLASALDADVVDLEEAALADAIPEGGLVFNATPVDPPVPDEALAQATAFDANYADRAAFARRARAAGGQVLDGLDLLVGQGVRSLAFWTDAEPGSEIRGVMNTAARTGALTRTHRRDPP